MSIADSSSWRLTTSGGIPIKSLSCRGTIGKEEASAEEVLLIRSTDLSSFAAELMPTPIEAFGGVIYPSRRRFPGAPWLQVESITWEPFDDRPVDPFSSDSSAPSNTYGEVLKVTLHYKTAPENDDEQDPNDPTTFLEVSSSASGQYLHGELRGAIDEDGEPIKEPDVLNMVVENIIEWSVRWPQIPGDFFRSTLMERLRKAIGKVNSKEMKLFNNAPRYTILFASFEHGESYTWRAGKIGESPINLTMKFVEKNFESPNGTAVTHRHVWIPNKGWKKFTVNGHAPYAEYDFDQLFRLTSSK